MTKAHATALQIQRLQCEVETLKSCLRHQIERELILKAALRESRREHLVAASHRIKEINLTLIDKERAA